MAKADSKVDQVLDIIKDMTILELRDLNEKITDVFGITAAAPVAVFVSTIWSEISWRERVFMAFILSTVRAAQRQQQAAEAEG